MSRWTLAAVALALAVTLGTVLAQPYAAAGGWARPETLPALRPTAAVDVAITSAGPTVAWADPQGVWAAEPGAEPRLVAAAESVRSLSAGSVAGELAVAWAERDRTTGVYHHRAWLGGQVIDLFDDPLDVSITFVTLGGAPYAAATLRRGGEARLTLLPLGGGAGGAFHTTALSVRGVTYAEAPGGLWVAWLEGKTERTEFGLDADWNAYAAFLEGASAAPAPLQLGKADVTDERQRAVVVAAPSGAAVLWTGADGQLHIAEVAPGASALGRTWQQEAVPGVPRPLAGAWPNLYWIEDTSFRRLDAGSLAAGGEALVTNVLWSPVTVEDAAFAHSAAGVGAGSVGGAGSGSGGSGLDALAWYGRGEGGYVQLLTSNDGSPMRLTWRDRLAKAMGWNPWFVWEQAIGQALTALLVGVIAVLACVPYLLVVSSLAARRLRGRVGRGRVSGLLFGAAPLVVAAAALAITGVHGTAAPLAALWHVLLAVALGVAVGYLVAGRGDREAQATLLVAAALTVFGSAAVWSFVTYPAWAPLVGLA